MLCWLFGAGVGCWITGAGIAGAVCFVLVLEVVEVGVRLHVGSCFDWGGAVGVVGRGRLLGAGGSIEADLVEGRDRGRLVDAFRIRTCVPL